MRRWLPPLPAACGPIARTWWWPKRCCRVVATAACGLGPRPGLTLVPAGDYPALRQAVAQALAGHRVAATLGLVTNLRISS
jgi:hypothetical protein